MGKNYSDFWQHFAAKHPVLWAFFTSMATHFTNAFPKKDTSENRDNVAANTGDSKVAAAAANNDPKSDPKSEAKPESKSESKPEKQKFSDKYGFDLSEAILLLLQLALTLGVLWLLWHVVVFALSAIMVVGLAIIGVVLNFVAGIAVPDLPQILPNAFHICEWGMSYADAMIAHAAKYFCELFENGIPNLLELIGTIRDMNLAPFWATVDQFWTELLNWVASL